MIPKNLEWLQQRIAAAERVEALPAAVPFPLGFLPPAQSLVPYMSSGPWGTAVMVRYDFEEDQQAAFNIAATLLPEGVKLAAEGPQAPEWTGFYPGACRSCGDPACRYDGGHGYICWKIMTKPEETTT